MAATGSSPNPEGSRMTCLQPHDAPVHAVDRSRRRQRTRVEPATSPGCNRRDSRPVREGQDALIPLADSVARRLVGEAARWRAAAARKSDMEPEMTPDLPRILQILALLLLANGTPVLATRLFGETFALPLDGGRVLADGRPIFGRSKTVRGILSSILVTALAAPCMGMPWRAGATVAAAAMAGDLCSSFVKRRLGLQTSSMALGIDQIPEALVPALAARAWLPASAADLTAVVVMFFAGELLLSRIAYHLKLRDRPY